MISLPEIRPLNPKGTWRTYTTADGLAGLQTEHLAEDAEGYLWIGTCSGGVSRFDGDEFRTFTVQDGLCSNLVYAIHLDRQGRLWFGTLDKGICWYDGNAFHHLEGCKTASVTYLFEDQEGCIWFGGRNTLGYCDAKGLHDLLPVYCRKYDDLVLLCWGIAQDRQGDLWFGCNHLMSYDGERFHKYGEEEGLSAEIRGGSYAIGQDGERNLWVGAGNAIYCWDGQQFQPVSVDFKGLVRKIQQDREGRIWFCTTGAGVFCCDGAEFQHFTTQDGLAYHTVVGMLQDREGQYWFATWGGGISCYDPHTLQVFSGENLPHRQTYTLLEDHRGSIWAGLAAPFSHSIESMVVRCDSEGLVAFGKEEGLDLGGCLAICEDRAGNLWVGGVKGLARYDGQTVQRIGPEEGFEGIWVRTIREDEGSRLLFGHRAPTEVRITRYDGQGFQTLFRERGEGFDSINAILETRAGELWFARGVISGQDQGQGIGRLNPAGEISFYTVEDGLIDDRVEDLLEDRQGHLWIATLGGVSRFDGVRFQRFTTEEGLPHNQVHCIWEDRQGRLWFGTAGGVACFDGQVFQTIRSPAVIEVNDILQDRQGDFWFATINGPVRYTPNQVPPRVRLLRTVADQIYEGVEGLEISTSTRQVIFEYKGLSFRTHPKDILYTCRLQGHEEEWRKPAREMRAFYADLPPGDYLFEVRAIDRDLNYSAPARVRLKVIIDPRDARIDELEQRVRERTQKLEEANRALSDANKDLFSLNRELGQKTRQLEQTLEDKEKAQEALVRSESMAAIGTLVAGVAHELNNPLGAAYSLTQTVQEMIEEDTAEQLQQEKAEIVEHLAFSRKELNRAKEIVASLLGLSRQNQDYTEAVDLNTVVRDALRVLYNQYKKYDLNLVEEYTEGLPAVQGNFAQLGQVCMNLIKNAIEALKGQEGQIALKTYREGEQVVFECADTGPGIAEEVRQNIFKPFFTTKAPGEGTGLGLYICHQTVEKHHGEIEVDSEVGKGTVFRVRLPLGEI